MTTTTPATADGTTSMTVPSAPSTSVNGAANTNIASKDLLPSRSHLDRYGFLFGYPISHSMSPLFHNTIYQSLSLNQQQFFLESPNITDVLLYLQDPAFYGAAVTMPHKVNIIPHLDELAPAAAAVGACNTIYLGKKEDGSRKLIGTNTDVVGVYASFLHNIPENKRKDVYEGRPGMVVGGGGAARAALYAVVEHLGCKTVYLVNRDKSEVDVLLKWCREKGFGDGMVHVETVEQAEKCEDVGPIVACVPDLVPKTPEEKSARAVLEHFLNRKHKGAILEMAYHPKPWTSLAELSSQLGWQVMLGTEAMIYQGLAQDQLWLGKTLEQLPVEKVKKVIADELAKAAKH